MRKPLFSGSSAWYGVIASMAALAAMLAPGGSVSRAVAQPLLQGAPIPGSVVLPPGGSVVFTFSGIQPGLAPPPSGPNPPVGPPHLQRVPPHLGGAPVVSSLSDQQTTVSYDGSTLTVGAPGGSVVVPVLLPDVGTCAAPSQEPNVLQCTGVAQPGADIVVSFTTLSAEEQQQVVPVTYPAGWNLVGGPPGTVLGSSPGFVDCQRDKDGDPTGAQGLCATQTGATTRLTYFGEAAWVYYDAPTTGGLLPTEDIQLPVVIEGDAYSLVGNPFITPATVSDVDAIYIYDPSSGEYQQTTTIPPGQGAWVYPSGTSDALTISPAGT